MGRHGKEAETRQAFETLTAPHLNALFRFAVYRVRDVAQAEDLVQETCLKAFRAFERFDRGSNYQAWLFRILLNTITDFQRKVAREPYDIDRGRASHPAVRLDDADRRHRLDPEQRALAGSLRAVVQAAIERLPADWQSVVLLNFVEGLRYQEIADLLGIPLGTVMSRLYRARQELRHLLTPYLNEEEAHRRQQAPGQGTTVTVLEVFRKRKQQRSTQEAR
jgi:RNA polymerase sigma-70 factor (ECF subfamily)